jgi:kynureninase
VIDVPEGEKVVAELKRREVLVDYRLNGGIRIAPHFYNADDELELAVREMREIAGR